MSKDYERFIKSGERKKLTVLSNTKPKIERTIMFIKDYQVLITGTLISATMLLAWW
jgi:hypothetical protein